MATSEGTQPETSRGNGRTGSDAGRQALRAAAVAAATTAGAAAARTALTKARSGRRGNKETSRSSGATISSGLKAAWDAAREHVMPAAEEAAGALGRYVATDAPELVREVIAPTFIRSFEQARSETEKRGDDQTPKASAT